MRDGCGRCKGYNNNNNNNNNYHYYYYHYYYYHYYYYHYYRYLPLLDVREGGDLLAGDERLLAWLEGWVRGWGCNSDWGRG